MKVLNITIDLELELAYAYLGSGKVDKTLEVTPSINIDVKENGEIFGVEFLSFDSLHESRESLQAGNPELREEEFEAVIFAQAKVRERLAN
jgi:uncharacterized protein YuzE